MVYTKAMAIERTLRENREQIREIAERHGARNIRVFGSAARGDTRDDSDVDFLIEAGENTSPWFPAGLVLDLEELLGCKVDVVTEKALHEIIRENVLREAQPV